MTHMQTEKPSTGLLTGGRKTAWYKHGTLCQKVAMEFAYKSMYRVIKKVDPILVIVKK